jgi:hypothetical protein
MGLITLLDLAAGHLIINIYNYYFACYKGDDSELHGIYCRLQMFYHHSTGCPAVLWPYYKLSAVITTVLQQVVPLYYAVLCSTA